MAFVLRDRDVLRARCLDSNAALRITSNNERLLKRKLFEEGRGSAVAAGDRNVEHETSYEGFYASTPRRSTMQ